MNIFKNIFGNSKEAETSQQYNNDITNENPATAKSKGTTNNDSDIKMMNVHHLIVLDESGSMYGVTAQTISGCNETLDTIRQMQQNNIDVQKHFVSIYVFATDAMNSHYIRKDESILNVANITHKDYHTGGSTPLYDALGATLSHMETLIVPKESAGYVTIITDGEENASKEFGLKNIRSMIYRLKDMGVVFSFIGANISAKEYGERFGIDNTLQFMQDEEGMKRMWDRERSSKMRSSRKMKFYQEHESESLDDFTRMENSGRYYTDYDMSKVTPERITSLRSNEVFVFGSNVDGAHRGGAARQALEHFGAIMGQAEGMQGNSYAIPTVGTSIKELYISIRRFCDFAAHHPEKTFLVTRIGCGNAGLDIRDVAPMFYAAMDLRNVKLPADFIKYNNGDLAF